MSVILGSAVEMGMSERDESSSQMMRSLWASRLVRNSVRGRETGFPSVMRCQ